MSERIAAHIVKGAATSPWTLAARGQPMPVQTAPAGMMMNDLDYIWQTHCGVRGPDTKYQEEYRVLGNLIRIEVAAHLFSTFRDKSYEANARAVSRMLMDVCVR